MAGRGIRIIIIDDEIGVFNSINGYIGEKYHIEGYTSSKEGLKRLQEERFDLLILDYFIDEMNGENVVNEIRKSNKELYILLLTGYGRKVPGLMALENFGIQSYCEKSADFEKIIICIEGVIKTIEFFKSQRHTIGERIKMLRKLNNLSQDDVAKALEVQRSTISLYESGDAVPPTLSIVKLAKLFNVTTDYLLCYEFTIEK